MFPFFVRYGFPLPESNVYVAGHRVDFLFAAEKVIIECDGWTFHRDRASFENDRDREAERLHNILRSRRAR